MSNQRLRAVGSGVSLARIVEEVAAGADDKREIAMTTQTNEKPNDPGGVLIALLRAEDWSDEDFDMLMAVECTTLRMFARTNVKSRQEHALKRRGCF